MRVLFTNEFYKLERSLAVFMAETKGMRSSRAFPGGGRRTCCAWG